MYRSQRFILYLVLVMPIFIACATLMPSTSIATTTPPSVVTATLDYHLNATSIPSTSPSLTLSLPTIDSFQPVTRVNLSSSERILNMDIDSDGIVWLLTDHRVLQYSQGAWTDHLPRFSGTIMGIDLHRHAWVISDDGTQVSVWDGFTWTDMGPERGWKPPTANTDMSLSWSIATDALGHIWLAADRDVRMFDGLKWKTFDLKDLGIPLPELEDAFSETSVAFLNASGYIWINHCYWIGLGPLGGGGARWYDGHAWQGSDSPVAHGCATQVNEDKQGNIWLGLDDQLWRLNTPTNSWKRFRTPQAPQDGWFGFFSDLALDPLGNPWPELTVCGGASCYTGNIRYHVAEENWLQVGDIAMDQSHLYFDSAGQGWVFPYEGVFQVAGNQLEPVAELPTLKVTVAPSGKLWIAGNYEGEIWLWAQP